MSESENDGRFLGFRRRLEVAILAHYEGAFRAAGASWLFDDEIRQLVLRCAGHPEEIARELEDRAMCLEHDWIPDQWGHDPIAIRDWHRAARSLRAVSTALRGNKTSAS